MQEKINRAENRLKLIREIYANFELLKAGAGIDEKKQKRINYNIELFNRACFDFGLNSLSAFDVISELSGMLFYMLPEKKQEQETEEEKTVKRIRELIGMLQEENRKAGAEHFKPVYNFIASSFNAFENATGVNNTIWINKHAENVETIVNRFLPSGAGIDVKNTFDFERSKNDRLIIYSSYHVMDENGFYDGWIDFEIIIKPSLQFDFDLTIKGRFGKRQDIKDYLHEIYNNSLAKLICYPDFISEEEQESREKNRRKQNANN